MSERAFGLDIVRASAILFVFVGHGIHLLPKAVSNILEYFILDGVSIFFVLSGFLIGGIFIKDVQLKGFGRAQLFNFWKRRWFRTLPAYFVVFTGLFLFYKLANIPTDGKKFEYVFFIQNFSKPPAVFFAEAWSLSVEEWFYLLFPLLFFIPFIILKQDLRKSVVIVLLIIGMFCLGARMHYYFIYTIKNSFEWELVYRMQVITRLDSIMLGVLGAFLQLRLYDKWATLKVKFLFVGLTLIVISKALPNYIPGIYSSFFGAVFLVLILPLGVLCSLPYFSQMRRKSDLFFRMVTFISLISYSIYLTHRSFVLGIILSYVEPFIQLDPLLKNLSLLIIYIVVTLFVSMLLYKLIEKPFMRLRDMSPQTIKKRLYRPAFISSK